MPLTAYSNQFQGEFDVVQLLKLLDPNRPATYDSTNISQPHRDVIAATVVCPGCGLGNPSVVAAGKSRSDTKRTVSQAHFRFDVHKPFCEFEGNTNPTSLADHQVDFRSTRSAVTQLIGQRVSKGIELDIFSQATMRAMRQWFLELRIANSYRCEIDEAFIDELFKLPYDYHSLSPKFTPAMARLPHFNPSELGNLRFVEENPDIYDVIKRYPGMLHFMRSSHGVIVNAVKRNAGALIFNPQAADREYKQARQLIHFVTLQERSVTWPPHFFGNERSAQFSHMSAFCALLLFSNSGDMDKAIEAYVNIRTSGPPANPLSGNIIGLNPFYDQGIWSVIAAAHEVKRLRSEDLVVGHRIDEIRREMLAEAFPRP